LEPISDVKNPAAREKRFEQASNSLYKAADKEIFGLTFLYPQEIEETRNPAGRPKDKTPATMLRKAIADDMPDIVKKTS
jgi:hypothetical protein